MPLFLGVTALILAEISLYVTLGAWIGLGATLLEVLGTAAVGVLIVRAAGRGIIDRLVDSVMDRRNPLALAGDRVLVAIGGVLLILPGFLTDLAGLVLLLPPVRQAILARLGDAARRQAADLAMDSLLTRRPRHTPSDPGPMDAIVIGETEDHGRKD